MHSGRNIANVRERLGESSSADAKTSPPVRSTEIIVGGQYVEKVLPLVKGAKREILICAYAWRWYENQPERAIQKFNYEIVKAMHRGVTVRAILEVRSTAQTLRDLGVIAKSVDTNQVMHIKAITVDDRHLVIGSHNLTKRGTAENYEASVILDDPSSALSFKDYFESIWSVA